MRSLPSNLTAKLESGVTTLARCWRLTRRDGVVLGFTDHDRDITFEGTTFEAGSGLSASEITASVGLSVDNLEVDGALSSDRLAEADLAAGVYDDAAIEIFVVDWAAPEDRFLERAGSIGEVSRGAGLSARRCAGLPTTCSSRRGGCSSTRAMRIWGMGVAASISTIRLFAARRSWSR